MKWFEMRAVAGFLAWHIAAVELLSCATVGGPVKACTQGLTEDLTASASDALAGDDYEHRIEIAFAGVAACLVVAAVEAAIDRAKTIKLAGPRAAAINGAIQLHGEAWLTTHRRT